MIVIFLMLFMISIGIVVIIRSDFFSVKKVEVLDNEILTKSQIMNLSKIELGKNIYIYNLKNIKNNIEENPYIDKVSIKRKIPDRIVVEVKEKKVLAALNQDDKYYYIDDNGNLIDEIDKEKLREGILTIHTKFNINDDNIKYVNSSDKKYLVDFVDNVKRQNLQNEMNYIDFTDKEEIKITGKYGLNILILKNKDIDKNIAKLSKILLDLNNKKIFYGTLCMKYKNYVLYTPYLT